MAIKWYQTLKLAGFLLLNGAIAFSSQKAVAQNIVPDNTLGSENSTVTPNVEVNGVESDLIEGGAQRGANLFHSFSEFNVEGGRGAYFANPTGIENILGRVTGANSSEILGTLGVQGDANLFLINPNGIIFGENARLDVGGSFLGSTADSILFPNGIEFGANDTQAKPILTINAPIGLGLPSNPGEIVNRSRVQNSAGDIIGLEVGSGKNLALVGGQVNFEGGQATARGGNIELGGLSVAGQVSIEEDGSLNFPEDVAKADVSLSNAADVDVRGTGAGNIDINAKNLELLGIEDKSSLRAGAIASSIERETQAGDINIDVAENIAIDNSSISNLVDPEAVDNAGDINITTTNLNLTNGARVAANTSGRGNSGSVRITSDEIAIDTGNAIGLPSGIFSQVERDAAGDSGGVNITTTNLSLTNGGRIASNTGGTGNAGGVEISATDTTLDGRREREDTRLASGIASLVDPGAGGNSGGVELTTINLNLTNGARIGANTSGQGNSGSVRITSDEIAIDTGNAIGLPSGIFSQVERDAAGDSGGVNITTTNLNLKGGGRIASNTTGKGDAGGVNINAGDTITVDGERSSNGLASGIASRVDELGEGNSGDVTITATNITMTNGGEIDVDTKGQGNAGLVDINASNNIIFDGEGSNLKGSGVDSSVNKEATGNAGSVNLKATNITMTDGGKAIAGTFDRGDAGEVNITASNNIIFDGEGSEGKGSGANSSVNQGGIGNAGGVNITAANLTITNGGRADVSTGGKGNAGAIDVTATNTITIDGEGSNSKNRNGITSFVNKSVIGDSEGITINTKNLVLTDGGEISANTSGRGDAGKINITATDTITLDGERNSVPEGSKISSNVEESGVGDSGGLEISTKNLILTDGGVISASTVGQGDAGEVNITATDTIEMDGVNSLGFGSGINSIVRRKGIGNAGDLTVNTPFLSITNGGRVSVNTLGQGNAGNLTVNASEAITLNGIGEKFRSNLSANALVKDGTGGNIDISTNRLTIENGAAIEASNFDSLNTTNGFEPGTGQPGNINIEANSIALSNEARINAATQSPTGIGGIIELVAEDITLRDRSRISARAFENANGGNLNIDAQFIIASPLENNDIVANASQGNGGNITINADSLFGIEERPLDEFELTNDIDASSEFGLSGTVEINTPDVDRDRDLVQLPTQPTETEIVQACASGNTEEQSEFVIKGRGGLPPSPEDTIDGNVTAVDWVTRQPQNPNSPSEITNSNFPESEPIIEAQGWIVDDNNEIALVAHNPNNAWQNSPQCQERAGGRGRKGLVRMQAEVRSQRSQRRFGSPHVVRSQSQRDTASIRAEGRNYSQSHSLLHDNSSQNILIASIEPKSLAAIPERISVERFEVEGNQVFSDRELVNKLAPFTDKPLSFAELLQARTAITEYYTERGYITSGAYIPLQKLQDKVVTVRVIEGYLEEIKVTGDRRLNSDYLSSRIETATDDSLQQEKLLSALQLLQQDPLIASLSAELEAGTRPGASVLELEVNEADSFKTPILVDNRRTPSVGSFRRQFAINEGNLLGFGDNLFLAYSNTKGSDAFDGSYGFPFNASNGTITVRGGVSSSEVVEEPFDLLNILGDSYYYELSLRQPLVQTPTQEFALGITASRRNSNISSLLEEFDVPPSELSPGANEAGQTKVSALRFFQEWTRRSSNEVIAARSQFNLGLGAFDATVNDDAPDSRFVSWQGQAQWTRELAPDTLFLLRGGIQLATTSLLPSEQSGLGGLETLRGYRQDLLLTDNSALATAEIRLPIFRIRATESVFQLAPFFDVGTAWNNGGRSREVAGSNTLASIGLGLRLSLFNSFTARFDWGIPLVAVDTEDNTWQENGLYFSIEHSPF